MNIKEHVSAVVIIACLALLGGLAYLHIEGAAVAAIAAVTTIIAWVTRPPNNRNSAKLVPFVGIVTIFAAAIACVRPPTSAEVGGLVNDACEAGTIVEAFTQHDPRFDRICASLPELAEIATEAFRAPSPDAGAAVHAPRAMRVVRASTTDAGPACTLLPNTVGCLTDDQLVAGIARVRAKRVARGSGGAR